MKVRVYKFTCWCDAVRQGETRRFVVTLEAKNLRLALVSFGGYMHRNFSGWVILDCDGVRDAGAPSRVVEV